LSENQAGNKFSLTVYVDENTCRAIEENRGSLKRSTYTAMVLDEIFSGIETKSPFSH